MKVIIAGSRENCTYDHTEYAIIHSQFNITEVVSGTANGVDKFGEQYAVKHSIPIKQFPANWKKHGRSAGYIRNKEMVDYADALIAVWDSKSNGTKHTIDLAKAKNIPIWLYVTPQVLNRNTYNCDVIPYNSVYIGRGSKWGNPFKLSDYNNDRVEVCILYRDYLLQNHKLYQQIEELHNKCLFCYCSPALCHGDILLELAKVYDNINRL